MPRRAPRDYYSEEEEIYEAPRRQKRPTARAPAADDEEYYVRKRGKSKSRIPVAAPPPVEEFERLHVRDRAPAQPQPPVPPPMPLGVRYGPAMDMEGFAFRRGKGDVGEKKGKKGRKSKSAPVSEESEESEDDEVRVKHVKRPKSKSRNRRREIVEDDEVVYKEKKGGKKAKGKKEKYIEASETESSSEEEEEYAVPVRRGGRPMVAPVPVPVPVPIDDEDSSEEEVVHRRKKKGKMPVEPEYERASRKVSKRGKETVRYPSVPKMKSHRRDETESETDTESESETTSDDSDGEIVVRKSERRGRSKGNKAKHRKDDSSGSPNLRAPSVSRKRQQKFIDTGMTPLIASSQNNYSLSLEYEMVKPTRAQSPDFPRSKSKKGGRSKDDMFIEPFDPYANWPPAETSSKKKKSKVKAIQPRARSADRDVSREHGRRMKDARNARDDLEVDLYNRRKTHYPAADFVPPKAGALVAPKSRRGRGTSMSEMGWPQPAGRKLKYLPEESSSEESSEDEKATPYLGTKPKHQAPMQKDRLWTEITKDLVVREAIERAGYEYEETDQFYYIFAYLHYVRPTTPTYQTSWPS